MKIVRLLLTGLFAGCTGIAVAQTLFLKPGKEAGIDAVVVTMKDSCHVAGQPLPSHLTNFGNEEYLHILAWTFNSGGCPQGRSRSLIKFAGLSTLPAGAIISSATMKLYHLPPTPALGVGNNYYPGSPYGSNTNTGTAYLIDRAPSGAWNETTVTWANMPDFEPAFTAPIPVTTTQWNGSIDIDVTNLVQEIVAGGGTDNGFYLKLDTEAYYRSQFYASSDHPNQNLWPELSVSYTVPPGLSVSSGASRQQLAIYPNPVKSNIKVRAPEAVASISLYSIFGQSILQQANVYGKEADIDVAGLAQGIYIINILTQKGTTISGRFVKE